MSEKSYINNLSLKSLEKIFLVLDDIKYNMEIQNKTTWLDMKQVEGIEGVPKDEHKNIMTTLLSCEGITSMTTANGDCCLDVDIKKFNKLLKSVIDKIDELKTGKPQFKNTKNQLKYNSEEGILLINSYEIKFSLRDKKTIAQDILEYIFTNEEISLEEQFDYSDIAFNQFRDEEYTKNSIAWRKYYTACMDIQDKVRKQTSGKIEDFLIYNSSQKGYVKINPKYLVLNKNKPLAKL